MITCKCPAAASLPDIPAVKCAESFGQIQKVAFQRLTKDDGSKKQFYHGKGNYFACIMDAVIVGG